MGQLLTLIKGCIAFSLIVINTLLWVTPVFIFGLLKLLPIKIWRKLCTHLLHFFASAWITGNDIIASILHPTNVIVEGDIPSDINDWYMVIANHQSWVDILILQRIFNRNIPFLKFFLKQELIYVPVMGLAWWALDFPFMRRYSAAKIKKNPKLKGKDIEITRKACQKFKSKPVSVMNFVEGTRFTQAKHSKQQSQFKHLLKPKAGGMAFALSALGENINKLVDVTIYYPEKTPSYWQFISGQVKQVNVHVKVSDIGDDMKGDYLSNREFKQHFQHQLNDIWQQKDAQLEKYHQQYAKQAKE